MTERPFRIAAGQSGGTVARQALMIAANELGVLGYRQPYQLGDSTQRTHLLHTLNTEFNTTIPLPPKDTRAVFYLVVDLELRKPILVPESDVVPFVFGYVLRAAGLAAAQRVSYRAEMLPVP